MRAALSVRGRARPGRTARGGGALALALAAAVGAACADDGGAGRPGCVTRADCDAGRVCEASRCVLPVLRGPARVHAELTPPLGSPYVRAQVLDVSLVDPQALVRLSLPAPTEYEVVILDADGAPLDGRLTLAGQARIAGRALDAALDVRANSPRTRVVRLLEGSYRATVQRLDQRPSLSTTFSVRAAEARQVKEFRFRPYRRLYGEVSSSVEGESKLAGVRVLALSEAIGLASTTSVSDALGRYLVELPDADDASFRVLATPPPALQPAWGYEEVVRVELDADREKRIAIEPTAPGLRGTARIRVGAASDGFIAAAGANVTLTATATRGLISRSYRLQGSTDGDGYLMSPGALEPGLVPVLRGRYRVDVEPPEASPFGQLHATLDLTDVGPDTSPDVQLLLPLEARVVGTVRSERGRPVPWASVELARAGSDAEPTQVVTDAEGAFEARLEPGPHLMVVRPAASSAVDELLPVALRAIEVPPSSGPRAELRVTLPRGVRVRGSVTGALRLEGVGGTKVELLAEVEGRAVSLAEAETDAAGTFQLLVPETSSP